VSLLTALTYDVFRRDDGWRAAGIVGGVVFFHWLCVHLCVARGHAAPFWRRLGLRPPEAAIDEGSGAKRALRMGVFHGTFERRMTITQSE